MFSVISAYSLSNYVKENIKFSLLLSDETSVGEAKALLRDLGRYDFIRSKDYISREDAAIRSGSPSAQSFNSSGWIPTAA